MRSEYQKFSGNGWNNFFGAFDCTVSTPLPASFPTWKSVTPNCVIRFHYLTLSSPKISLKTNQPKSFKSFFLLVQCQVWNGYSLVLIDKGWLSFCQWGWSIKKKSALNCPNFIHCLPLPLHLQIEEDPKLNPSQLRSILLIAIRFASGDFSMPLSGEETRLSRWLGRWWPWDLEWYCYIYIWVGGFGLKFAKCLGTMFYLWSDFEVNVHFIWIIWQ